MVRRERLLEVEELRVSFPTVDGRMQALNGVNLTIDRGEVVGLIGESGAGKSLVAWSIMGLVPESGHVTGRIKYRGLDLLSLSPAQLREIRGQHLALIPPNARSQLNPLMSVGTHLANVVRAHRQQVPHRQAMDEAIAMMEAVGIPDPLITRDLGVVAQYCDRAAVMYGGEIVEEADIAAMFAAPSHPYSQALVAAMRYYDVERVALPALTMSGPSLDISNPPEGCSFYERCPRRMEACRHDHPRLRSVAGAHRVRCHLYPDP